MRFKPKFEPVLEERPEIFNIGMLVDYVGGSRKVWAKIIQDPENFDTFIKVDPIGISYSFITKLSREDLQKFYLNNIYKRKSEVGKNSILITKLNYEKDE